MNRPRDPIGSAAVTWNGVPTNVVFGGGLVSDQTPGVWGFRPFSVGVKMMLQLVGMDGC